MDNKQLMIEYVEKAKLSDSIIDGKRIYVTPEGNRYPSVTTILSAMSDNTWKLEWEDRVGKEEADRITKEACDRGTNFHLMVENYFNEIKNDKYSLQWKLFRSVTPYLKHFKPLSLETPLYSDKLKVAGRTDFIGYYKDNICIADWKTSSKEKQEKHIKNYFVQATIYALMLFERTGIICKKIIVVIGVDKGFPQIFIKDTKDYVQDAINVCNAYHAKFGDVG